MISSWGIFNPRPAALALQGLCAGYYCAEVSVELSRSGVSTHTVVEGTVTVILLASLVSTVLELRRTLRRTQRIESSLHLAAGAFQEGIRLRFAEWALSPAEAEVAMFLLKGFSTVEIAKLRQAAQGTVRVQLSNIYAKSGAIDRSSFVACFIEDLIEDPIAF